MNKPLTNCLVLVTGASSGIGKSTAIECAKAGANLIITGRNEERLTETANEIKKITNISPVTLSGDLSDPEFRNSLQSALDGQQIHGLALCAGAVSVIPITFATEDKILEIFRINFLSNVEIIRLLLKGKNLKRGSSVVVVTSVLGIDGYMPGNAPYGASKAALESWLKNCALEYASKGIRFNSIHPGSIDTPMLNLSSITQIQIDQAIAKIPMKRIGLPSEIAKPIVFLLSDQSSFMTGSCLLVDGGQHLIF